MYIEMTIQVIAGLGLFLFGMNLMGSGLQKVAGNKLKSFIELLTKNRFIAVGVGMIVTMIIQSSSATSVMVVGFVNAGIMSLMQAVGVIMGANIGTTITGQMVSIDLVKFAPLFLGIGLVISGVSKSARKKNIAEILIGFGILFIGMGILKTSLGPLKQVPAFKQALLDWGNNPLQGVIIGFVLTVLMQSSSATIGLLIALAYEGLLPFSSALYILYGDNIGTCTTALISSIGSSKNARRVAVMHLSFNIIGTIIFIFILQNPLIEIVKYLDPLRVERQIANAHTIFNITNVIIQLPFAAFLIKLSKFVIRTSSEPELGHHLDPRILTTPSIALRNTLIELSVMANDAYISLNKSYEALKTGDKLIVLEAKEYEDKINESESRIMHYLQDLSKTDLSSVDRNVVDELFNTVNDLERIGDHADNICGLVNHTIKKKITLDEELIEELDLVFNETKEALNKTITAFFEGDIERAHDVSDIEKRIDKLEKKGRKTHIKRMNKGLDSIDSGIVFLDVLSNFERVSDHCKNISHTTILLEGNTKIS